MKRIAIFLVLGGLAGGCGKDLNSDMGSEDAGDSDSNDEASGDLSGTTGEGSDGGDSTNSTSGGTSGTGDDGSSTGDDEGCLPMSVQDDFADPELDTTRWTIDAATGMTIGVVNERLTFTPVEDFNNTRHASMHTTSTFDLNGCSTWVEVPRVLPEGILGETFVALLVDGQNNASVRVAGTGIQFNIVIDGEVSSAVLPYDPDTHRWWRMREEAGVMHLETSATGDAWTEQLQESHPWDPSAVRLGFTMHTNAITGTFEGPQFDNVNVGP